MMFEFGFLDEDSQEGRSRRYVGHLQAISASRHYGLQRSLLGRRRNQPRLFKSQCYLLSAAKVYDNLIYALSINRLG